jgi:type IV secretory pathway protease TraF
MPIGIYRLTGAPPGSEMQSGMFVSVCALLRAGEFVRRRGYLNRGGVPANAEPLLKAIAAVAGVRIALW